MQRGSTPPGYVPPPRPLTVTVELPVERMEDHYRAMDRSYATSRGSLSLELRTMYMCGAFGIHPERRHDGLTVWRVSHARTGMYVCDFANLLDAIYTAGVLMGSGFDWASIETPEQAQALRGTEPWRVVGTLFSLYCEHLAVPWEPR